MGSRLPEQEQPTLDSWNAKRADIVKKNMASSEQAQLAIDKMESALEGLNQNMSKEALLYLAKAYCQTTIDLVKEKKDLYDFLIKKNSRD